MSHLILSLKREWFEAIAAGEKTAEYRLATEFWKKRLSKPFKTVEFTLGYPKKEDQDRRMTFEISDIQREDLLHPFFGDQVVDVFAIHLGKRIAP